MKAEIERTGNDKRDFLLRVTAETESEATVLRSWAKQAEWNGREFLMPAKHLIVVTR